MCSIYLYLTQIPPSPVSHSTGAPGNVAINITSIKSEENVPVPKTPTEVAELFARLEDALIKQMEVGSKLLTSIVIKFLYVLDFIHFTVFCIG